MHEREITPELLAVLRKMDLFKGKDADELSEWLGKAPFEGGAECSLKQANAKTKIVEEGAFGNSFFIVLQGSVRVTIGPESRDLELLGPGSFFGEAALMSGAAHSCTFHALEPCWLVEVPRRAFELWMKKPGPFRDGMDQSYSLRSLASHLRLFLDSPKIDAKAIDIVARRVKLRIFSRDEVIVREGDEADSFYLIRDGYVRIVKKMTGGEQRTVAYLNDGGFFGEGAVLSGGRRDFSVFAAGRVEVVQVMRNDLLTLVKFDPSIAERFRETQKTSPDRKSVV